MTDEGAGRRARWTARLGAAVVWLLARTWRVRYDQEEALRAAKPDGRPVVFVIWHGQLLMHLWAHRRRQISVLISEHRDGEIIARVAELLGYRTVRGSTTRGANRALIGLVRELEAGYDVAITPDGPRGPYHSFAPGALLVAQRSRRPVVAVGAHASRAWQFGSWDRFTVPKPFARVTISYGAAIPAPDVSPRALSESTGPYRKALEAGVAAAAEAAGR
ncbi:MAG TPA: lysophospholipid acyltransferase family protein [Gemmatimonadaceae bacterium]|nr:lysophospholipid acyltransferase family protein [Gemmatimonadaceae bacterium]